MPALEELLDAFQHSNLVGVGERHWSRADADFRLQVIRAPAFAECGADVVVEFAAARHQELLDRFVDGEAPVPEGAAAIWRDTTQRGAWESPVYEEFLLGVREVNRGLPRERRIRVLAADPGEGLEQRDSFASSVIAREILNRGRKALVVFGALHLYRNLAGNIVGSLDHPSARWFVVVPLGGPDVPAAVAAALAPAARPALAPLAGSAVGGIEANQIFEKGTKRIRMVEGKPVLEPAQVFAPGVPARDVADAVLYFGEAPPEFVRPRG